MTGWIKPVSMIVMILILFLLERVIPFYSNSGNRLIKHDLNNLILSVLNGIAGIFLVAAFYQWIKGLVQVYFPGVFRLISLPLLIEWVSVFLILDLLTYIWHRMNHEIRFLWMFHRVHHTDTILNYSTALRFHPLEILLSALFRLPFYLLLGTKTEIMVIYEVILNLSSLFHHSNIHLSRNWDQILRLVIPTPAMHRYHHSADLRECHSNYSSILSVWDRLFGSYTRPDHPEKLLIGLNIFRDGHWQNLPRILLTPFYSLIRSHKGVRNGKKI